jgi:hypothetical protein
MLAIDIIFNRLKRTYVDLLNQEVYNKKHGIKDSKLDCNIALAYSLIKIYPWLYPNEYQDWRDQIEVVCGCTLPCVTCDGQIGSPDDYDPLTMKWIPDKFECEDIEGIWVPDIDTAECEDDGITTTISTPPTTHWDITTTPLPNPEECFGPFSFVYLEGAQGPNALEVKYLNCNGVETPITFIKGQLNCITYRRRPNGAVFVAVDPTQEQYLNASKFSSGVYPC